MVIVQFTRFKGGTPEEIIPRAKRAKAIIEKHGAEWYRISRIHTGPSVGEWLVSVRYADWATYGKVQEAVSKDADFQQLQAETLSKSQMVGRMISVSVDL